VEGVSGVSELRLVVTAADYEEALRFYRDVLGLAERAAYSSPGGRVTILEAGRATLEIADPNHAEYIDDVEVGRRVAGHIRVAFQVPEARSATATLAEAGARVIAEPTPTPWNSLNSRLDGPAGLQLTLFSDLPDALPAAGCPHSRWNMTCRPTRPSSAWSKAAGTVPMIWNPSDCHRWTAGALDSTTALNWMPAKPCRRHQPRT
jgi:lactoylglutathione lyase